MNSTNKISQVDNTENYQSGMWRVDIIQASTANIDAFALNIAADKAYNAASIAAAFAAAESLNLGFKLFFSFDYAGNGAWAKADVLALLAQYSHHPNCFQHAPGRPLVSTFEGPGSAADWVEIKRTTGCFFMPDWSSLGAKAAINLEVCSVPYQCRYFSFTTPSCFYVVRKSFILTYKSGWSCRWAVQLGSLAIQRKSDGLVHRCFVAAIPGR